MKLPTLYGLASNGSVKEWSVWTVEDTIFVQHGKLGGKLQVKETKAKPKNVGKANETSPSEQAEAEALSKWNKQKDKDYKESVDDLTESTLPPLAKKFQDAKHLLGEEYDVLPKLDGVRCTLFHKDGVVRFQSRGGKDYPVIEAIAEDLKESLWNEKPNIVVDCELYSKQLHLEDIVSCVKKHNDNTWRIESFIFDIFDPDNPEYTWEERYQLYTSIPDSRWVKTIDASRVKSEEEMKEIHDFYVDCGGLEGVVLRKLDGKFVFGHRTSDFQKYKVALDEEFEVIRIDIDKNGCAVPWCKIDNKVDPERTEFKAPLVGTREYQQDIANNKENYIGKYLTVVFESYSKYGIPGKPKGHNFREVDENGNPTE